MRETVHLVSDPWLFYALGYIGILLYILAGATERGSRLDVFIPFLKERALPIIATIVTYNAVLGTWMFSNAFSFFGLHEGELSGMSIFVAFSANELWAKLVDRRRKGLAPRT